MIISFDTPYPSEFVLYPDWTFPPAQPVEPEETISITGGSSTPGISIGGSADQTGN